jgi:hypothetical protein
VLNTRLHNRGNRLTAVHASKENDIVEAHRVARQKRSFLLCIKRSVFFESVSGGSTWGRGTDPSQQGTCSGVLD